MFAIPLRFTICLLLGAVLLSSCGTGNPADAYPTYDPFAPVNGGGSQVAPVGGIHRHDHVEAIEVGGCELAAAVIDGDAAAAGLGARVLVRMLAEVVAAREQPRRVVHGPP